MKKNLLFVLLILFISGCETTEGYRKIVESWVGSAEIDLIRSWGAPQHSYQSGDTKFIAYNSSQSVYIPGTTPTYTTTVIGNTTYTNTTGGIPAQNIQLSCGTTFEIRDEIIVSWSFRGNDCTAKEN